MSSIAAVPSSVTYVNHGQKVSLTNLFNKRLEHTDALCGQWSARLWHMHIFCLNALFFVDFWYDLLFILSSLQFLNIKNIWRPKTFFFPGFKYYFCEHKFKKWSSYLAIEHQSCLKSSKIDAFEQKICICHSPSHQNELHSACEFRHEACDFHPKSMQL